jgi:cell division septum initiation protein DivIVA
MSEQTHLSADLGHEDQFKQEMRGYNRREVDETVAALRLHIRSVEDGKRDMEDRLSQALDELERLRLELSAARSNGKPPHEEISERIREILKLADDEASSQRSKAEDEIGKLRAEAQADTSKMRTEAKAETDRTRAEAHEQAERLLSAAQEQADNSVSQAKSEADNTRKSANTEAQSLIADASKQAETAVSTAKSQAKQQLDEATARATAIHDGAERRLNLLMSRHTEAVRRLTEIRDVVTTLVAGEADRGSLEDEVARAVAAAAGNNNGNGNGNGEAPPAGRGPGGARPVVTAAVEGRHAGGAGQQQDGQPALSTASRPAQPGNGSPRPQQGQGSQPHAVAHHAAAAHAAPAGQPSASQTPAGQTPAGQTPAGQTPAGQAPRGQTAPGQSPAGRPPADSDDTAAGLKVVSD